MSYAIPVALFVIILLAAIVVLVAISKRSDKGGDKKAPFAEDKKTPLWATDEGSDA